MLRYNGTINKEHCITPSINARLDTIQAAILSHRLSHIKSIIKQRRQNAALYSELLADIKEITLPKEQPSELDVYYTYTIKTEQRDALMEHLLQRGIEVKIYHPILMPHQPPYKHCKAETKRASKLVKQILCLPIYQKLQKDDIAEVASHIRAFFRREHGR